MDHLFYTYAYLREDGSPYYIGKGKGNRAYSKDHSVPKPKDKSRIVILEKNLTEVGALALERRYIRWYGRKDNGTGILRNKTDGGEGSAGIILTPEQRKRRSEIKKGIKLTEEHRNKIAASCSGKNHPNYGTHLSEETRKKISESRKGYAAGPRSNETRKKISESCKGRIQSLETRQKISNTKRLLKVL